MIYSNRVTKYNPDKITNNTQKEWTSFHDIGINVTKEEYLIVENTYIESLQKISFSMKEKFFLVSELENYSNIGDYKDNQRINITKELSTIVQHILREQLWCKLIGQKCEFHFGYDYYMYVVSKKSMAQCINSISNKLFVEEFMSPYL